MDKIPILIVEDNLVHSKIIEGLLSLENYAVKTAKNAQEALAILKEFLPRLILMDIQLPGINGLELTQMIKSNNEYKGICVIATTAYAMKGDRERMLAAGCNDYLAKPFEIKELCALIKKHLSVESSCI